MKNNMNINLYCAKYLISHLAFLKAVPIVNRCSFMFDSKESIQRAVSVKRFYFTLYLSIGNHHLF